MTLLGHEEAWREWREAMAGGRMHHAWLLAGKKGLGKASFAQAAASELVNAIGKATHPDIVHLSHLPKDKKNWEAKEKGKPFEVTRNIKIDQVRELQQRLTMRPTLGERRAIVIDPADDLERNAANALLKSLEEPPVGTFFLLVAHQPARLLPTIRSRCRTLRFPNLPDESIERLLRERVPGAESTTYDAAVTAAAGSPGAALKFVEMDLGRMSRLFAQILRDGDGDFALRGQLAEAIGARPDRARLQAVFDLARAALSMRIMHGPADPRPLIEAHSDLVRLGAEARTYNYDAGLLAMEIGTLLASAAPASERAHG